ncbi:hypothetical protein D7U91_05365 [Stenotrophomonas maltophilia]|nr:hypothetical protein [Stenotrophomonas maltophilia]MBA0391296.1 hypothetical protein [Stenotrophomonas maltophilia]MBA0463882.1 hypothetical protein [Stenotrophomonas maltophilia]MBA0472370.1 hypothetical protein [Stenotrophomonas maltophilia]MBH1447250.1 hypothetical protein [Stenotrophomonas maltophilia]
MDLQAITALFGRSATDPAVSTMLQSLGVRRRPELARPAKSPYEAIVRVSARGMLFSFSERNYWNGRSIASHGKSGELIFTNVAVTAGIPDVMRRYEGDLLFGLQWEDDRTTARERLATAGFGDSLHAGRRDAWWLPDYRIRLTYQPGCIEQTGVPGIFDVSLGIPMRPLARASATHEYPSAEQVLAVLGKSTDDTDFQAVFRDLGLVSLMAEASSEVVDRADEHGFILYFDSRQGVPGSHPVCTGISFVRDRLGNSRAWAGPLPFGLQFDDPPSILEERMDQRASRWLDEGTFGSARWSLPGLQVSVNFDSLDNCLESVRVIAEGHRTSNCQPRG